MEYSAVEVVTLIFSVPKAAVSVIAGVTNGISN